VHGGDDLVGVDALQANRGRGEVGVAELALDDVERHAFAGELDGVGVAQLMRRKAPPHTGVGGKLTEPDPDPGARPGPAASGAVDDAEQRPDRQLDPIAEPGRQLLPARGVHAISRRPPPCRGARAATPAVHRGRARPARRPWTPSPARQSTTISARRRAPWRSAHHRDDFLDGRRVGGINAPCCGADRPGSALRSERSRSLYVRLAKAGGSSTRLSTLVVCERVAGANRDACSSKRGGRLLPRPAF
jgi:hypothetical protein